jgi:hypothetical protein
MPLTSPLTKEEAVKSNKLCFFELAALILAAGLFQGCADEGKFSNAAPSDVSLSVSRCFVPTHGTVQLGADATDADGDPLTYTWKAASGTFTPASATGTAVEWTASADPGTVIITMTVTDDVVKVSKSQGVTVCTPLPTSMTTSRTIKDTGFTYILTNNGLLRVLYGDTLTIEPGVTIVVDKETGGFEVFGRVIARGNPGDKIKVQGNTCTTGAGLWSGIYLYEPDCEGILSNVDIAMSKDGIQVYDGAKLAIDNSEIYDNENMGIGVNFVGSRAEIRSCKIWDNGLGIYVINGEAEIRRSSIRYSAGNGIELSFSLDSTQVVIDSCSIANNGLSGILLSEKAAPEIHLCSIFSNGEDAGTTTGFALRLSGYTATDSIQAQNNYWGVGMNSVAKIAALVTDKSDIPYAAQAYVDFTPYLVVSPVNATPRDGATVKGRPWERSSR